MSLDSALSNATSGLSLIARDFAIVSQNIANAATPGYAREIATQKSASAGGQGVGVRALATIRIIDAQLAQASLTQTATVSALTTTQTALQAIDSVRGTPGEGGDLSSKLGALRDAFTALAVDPSVTTRQTAVVTAAITLAGGIRDLAGAIGAQRQGAEYTIVDAVTSINKALGTIGRLTDQIINFKAQGAQTADLENQRDNAVQSLSALVSVRAVTTASGDLQLFSAGGVLLPTRGVVSPLSTSGVTVGPTVTAAAGGIPPITLGGADVTAQLTGGSLGASLVLRDKTLPTFQAQLDEFAQGLASRFNAQGLKLFTNGSGTVPVGGGIPTQAGYVGFAGAIVVNASIVTTPALVRDGTQNVAATPTGASLFQTNPAGGPSGFGTLISRILDFALGSQIQSGVPQPSFATSGLGAAGNLSAGYGSPGDLPSLAATLTAAQSGQSGAAAAALATETGVQTALSARVAQTSGVSVDTETASLVALQTAYGANARIIAISQTLFTQLLSAIQ